MVAVPKLKSNSNSIRVLIVDDSAVVRGLTSRWLGAAADIELIGAACDGEEGIRKAAELQPDVVILDVEMPKLDGLSALPKILAAAPKAKVVMASTLTSRNADITLKALSAGAADYLPKPDTGRLAGAAEYQRDLVAKVRALAPMRLSAVLASTAAERAALSRKPDKQIYAKFSAVKPKALAIGASTGGPQALQVVVKAIGKLDVPTFITQHMPATFTTILAAHLDKITPATVVEGKDGLPVRPGHIYIAPGEYHMVMTRRAGSVVIQLNKGPAENFCRPAVDPMFRAAAAAYGPDLLAVVLTGMGHDGAAGSQEVLKHKGSVIAQDEASSVVWGMPGAVAAAGAACAIEPLEQIGRSVVDIFNGKRR